MKSKYTIISALMFLFATAMQAQINIKGNVYGGARQADVGGHAYVNIGADHHDVVIKAVYGGNDIAGTVGNSSTMPFTPEVNTINNTYSSFISTHSEGSITTGTDDEAVTTPLHIFIGQLFGGGNGAYKYQDIDGNDFTEVVDGTTWYIVKDDKGVEVTRSTTPFVKPELGKAYLELKGGTFGYVYGGGNNATVTGATDICIDIPIVENNTNILDINGADGDKNTNPADDKVSDEELQAMDINTEYFDQNGRYHISRVFGGNNLAPMAIQPTWHLKEGIIENIYSGGNEGKMTSPTGLLLEIMSDSKIKAENVYGGCRKADVFPSNDGVNPVDHVYNVSGYNFKDDFAARVIVRGGDIKNVYGGNDVSGRVYFGNAVGVYTDIRGDIYGGGNGSYAYTDNYKLVEENPLRYADFYYDPNEILGLGYTGTKAQIYSQIKSMESVRALNAFRPNAEQVSIRVQSLRVDDENKPIPTIIEGSIYCGGNSATLKFDQEKVDNTTKYPDYPIVELNIGSYVMAKEVFLGNNGANMVKYNAKDEAHNIEEGVLRTYASKVRIGGVDYNYSKMGLTSTDEVTVETGIDRTPFAEYMEGCAMNLVPSVSFVEGYVPYSTYIGSLYCGGNVGSMTVDGPIHIPFNDKVVIFDKVVGGCNNADVPQSGYNIAYKGGLLHNPDNTTGNKLELTFNGLKIEPKRLTAKKADGKFEMIETTIQKDNTTTIETSYPLEWNTVQYNPSTKEYDEVLPVTDTPTGGVDVDENDEPDLERRFAGGNIYGGCYASGHVNGNVVINLNADIVERDKIFDKVTTDDLGEEQSLYGKELLEQQTYHIEERRTGVILGQQGMDVLGRALNVFGGGYGEDSEIWGSTTINLNRGYTFQIFGGGEAGAIGQRTSDTKDEYGRYTYNYNPNYSCFINLRGTKDGVSKQDDHSEDMAECEFIYGGGFLGTIAGNTVINLGKGRVFNTFGGSCNADILGHTETYIGRQIKKETETSTDNEGNEIVVVTKDYAMDMLKHYNVGDKFQAATDFYEEGFPYVRDMVYGGNDLGGEILGESSRGANGKDCNFKYRVNASALGLVHKYNATSNPNPDVLKASAYVEYTQGRAVAIFGGCFGTYDYTDPHYRKYFNADGTPKTEDGYSKPHMNNAFVNFRPIAGVTSKYNWVKTVYGAGQGYPSMLERDELQNRSYVLVDIQIPSDKSTDEQKKMKFFGAGAWAGVGMSSAIDLSGDNPDYDKASAIIDLVKGEVGYVCGASYKEGFTRRTVVNVPGGITVGEGEEATTLNSTIDIQKIFGGGEGFVDTKKDYKGNEIKDEDTGEPVPWPRNDIPCDAYEANVNFSSPDAIVRNAIYGGNNACRRTLYGKVNINAPVHNGVVDNKNNLITATVYGAGCGEDTWSQYTEVNLNPGAEVFEVYGGGEKGRVINTASLPQWKDEYYATATTAYNALHDEWDADSNKANIKEPEPPVQMDLTMGAVCVDNGLDNPLVTTNIDGSKHNTNVHICDRAIVNSYYVWKIPSDDDPYETWEGGYAYGGGLGKSGIANSGDIYGTTYIDLQGGTVKKDLYGAGTQGSVMDKYGVGDFVASSNVFVKGGTARNVYGGGWAGSVGRHAGQQIGTDDKGYPIMDYLTTPYDADVPGETHVVIGTPDGTTFTDGIPAIERNAYGGGEGGAVWGTTNITLNKGYIGYRYFDSLAKLEQHDNQVIPYETEVLKEKDEDNNDVVVWTGYYQEKLHDETWYGNQTNRLKDSGCLFGGGYIDNSSVDITNVKMYGGVVRNSLFGGGEIAAIGRGVVDGTGAVRKLVGIYKAGKTHVKMMDGKVKRDVFGGGRGYNNLGESGTLYSDGYVFGQTEVFIHGGEIGTEDGVANGEGNVFGGGDIGYVYSAYEDATGHLAVGQKSGSRYDGDKEGYYYKFERNENKEISYDTDNEVFINGHNVSGNPLTEDCKVLIEPQCKVTAAAGVSFSVSYKYEETVSADDLDYLETIGSDLLGTKIDQDGKVTDTSGITFNRKYKKGEYVPIDFLNTLRKKNDSTWSDLQLNEGDDEGIIIHNAVFAGGNVSSGSDKLYANATTVFGNATASIHDVYHRDLITIGTGHTGGLYGDGNLTFVDGYRGLNVTNYGTDYYSLKDSEISFTAYQALPKREQAYYELRYVCIQNCTDDDGKEYHSTVPASTITLDEFLAVFENTEGMIVSGKPNPAYWKENGVCSRYAGRILNTIQRADFCGVFGSRMVMQGARDRVPSTVDMKNYTINRVREVSLNKKISVAGDAVGSDEYQHGNYFGIYNIVNNLGNLTSDVDFHTTVRTSTNDDEATYRADITITEDNTPTTYHYGDAGYTFYHWKEANYNKQTRNNGNSHNQVALASGVYLEVKDMDILKARNLEESSGEQWGYITGVVELDLINVQTGIGGGFVYAKNEHRKLESHTRQTYATLTALNADAVTRKDYNYYVDDDDEYDDQYKVEWETSGNFVHSTQVIIDDCYPKSNMYTGAGGMKAHYWYIKGEVYVYDQYISAYTGAPTAYSETVDIPLTITAASNGVIKLLDVQPNHYAYFSTNTSTSQVKLTSGQDLEINNVKYQLNDPISYWDYYMLSAAEKKLFVPKTYVTIEPCIIDGRFYPEGYVMLPEEYEDLKSSAGSLPADNTTYEYIYMSFGSEQSWGANDNNPAQWAPSTNQDYLGPTGDTWYDNIGDDLNYGTDGYKYTYVSVRNKNGETWSQFSTPTLLPTVFKATKNGEDPAEILTDNKGNPILRDFDFVFRESNNLSHDTGYILTYKVDNPPKWDTYYMPKTAGSGTEPWRTDKTLDDKSEDDGYHDSPTYRYIGNATGELLGQRAYEVTNLISKDVYDTYQNAINNNSITSFEYDQAEFYPAYLMTDNVEGVYKLNDPTTPWDLNTGAAIAKEEFVERTEDMTEEEYAAATNTSWDKIKNHITPAFVSTKTITLSETEYIGLGQKMTETERTQYCTDYGDQEDNILENVVPAYYCASAGYYGGDYYKKGVNYRALAAWSSMSEADRKKFAFNYDAFDLLIDPTYSRAQGVKYQYDGNVGFNPTTANDDQKKIMIYSLPTPVDYQATYKGSDDLYYTPDGGGTQKNAKVTKELSRTEYESLANEQRHYAPITVTEDENVYYVVKKSFYSGDSNYPAGTVLKKSAYDMLTAYHDSITTLTFASGTEGTFYFCREKYTVGEKGRGVTPEAVDDEILTDGNESYSSGDVPVGLVIGSGTQIGSYGSLPNDQEEFVIHGKSPVETSTLFVSRNSDIYDLSKEKIITVIYQYDYDQTDTENHHITPITERHVVNIHITFKSGVPEVEDINTPKIVIPGTGVSMSTPHVKPGAYEVTGGGWELFANDRDLETHTNGIEYKVGVDPLYWYQDGYYLTYYAETYLGKTYSNEVKVSVANYHDLKKVMDAKTHHYYIDKKVKRDPKIYIKDYSGTDENGLDMLKNLFDLTLLRYDSPGVTEGKVTATGDLKDHSLLNERVKGAQDLEFFLRSNIDQTGTGANAWTSIGKTDCFAGRLHGDGYYLSGLEESLFDRLCGQVYNLGVMGSFTGAGVAERGEGYVENCWIRTTGTPTTTGTDHHYPVFGNPSRSGSATADLVQVVNCYYPNSNTYETYPTDYAHGKATQMPDMSFYNGEVAYNLNGFYLKKRYYDQTPTTDKPYYFFKDVNGMLTLTQNPSNYPADYAFYPIEEDDPAKKLRGYVEERFYDGDFIYASGKIPDEVNQRLYVPPTSTSSTTQTVPQGYYPIWPDDYIFFGQRLNYDYVTAETTEEDLTLKKHQEVPSHIVKMEDRVLLTNYIDSKDPMNSLYGNRVYRAPAYFRDSKMNVAYFNPIAVFAQTKKGDATTIAYKNMTAIDFTGGNGDVAAGYQQEFVKTAPYNNEKMPNGAFYPPLLDDGGLRSFKNEDLTKNLLVYTGTASPAVPATNDVVAAYLPDRSYKPNNDNGHPEYKAAVPWDRYSDKEKIYGHRVEWDGSDYIAQNDHFLVDKEDFFAPISYTFADAVAATAGSEGSPAMRMWYQREPEELNYVGKRDPVTNEFIDSKSGWEGVSLPFTVDLVTTETKGEITHFYGGSSSVSTSGSKRGHEYWLREYKGGAISLSDNTVYVANFKYPETALDDGKKGVKGDKDYTNTFLWDYYYKYDYKRDKNSDQYQDEEDNLVNTDQEDTDQEDTDPADVDPAKTYYKSARSYKDYLRQESGRPYIIGFPGERYFEFDLSGSFSPQHTHGWNANDRDVPKQHIIFSSKPGSGTTIFKSDEDMVSVTIAGSNYVFKPSYLNDPELDENKHAFLLNDDGNSYVEDNENTTVAKVKAFRPYFIGPATPAASQSNPARPVTRSIVFGNDDSQLKGVEEKGDPSSEDPGLLRIYAKKHKIVVESALTRDVDIRIVNTAGITMTTFTIEPGETIETRINNAGVYIVQSSDNRYTKKLVVR